MVSKKVFFPAALVASLLVMPVNAQKVLLLPGAGSSVSVIANNTFTAGTPIDATSGAFAILANPQATRYFIISSSNITVADATGAQVGTPVGVGLPIADAAVTPDGQKLLVAAGTDTAGTLYIFDISTGTMTETGAVAIGANPSSVEASNDSADAFVVSAAGLRRVDLAGNDVTATLALSGLSSTDSKVVLAPNGLIYVNANGAVYEVVPRSLTLRKSIGTAGVLAKKPAFSPDGKTMLLANPRASTSAQPVLMTIDLATYGITNKVNYYGVKFDYLVWANADTLYAYSSSVRGVFRLTQTLDGLADTAVFPAVGRIANVTAVFASTEFPADLNPGPRYLYVLTAATLYRIDLNPPATATDSQITKSVAVPGSLGGVYIAPAAKADSAIGGILKYGDNQTVAGSTYSLPLAVRLVDATGKPIAGVPVTFVPSAGTIEAMPITNGEGIAQAILKAPTAGGEIAVTARTGSGTSVDFSLNGSGGGGGGTNPAPGGSGIAIVSGQGEVILGGKYVIEPLSLIVRNSSGAPVEGTSVTFSVGSDSGNGYLAGTTCGDSSGASVTCSTDENGYVAISYLAPSVDALFASWKQVTVTATVNDANGQALQTLKFFETAVPEKVYGYEGPLQFQKWITPSIDRPTITVQAGTTAKDAIQMQVYARSGPSSSDPIPNVGLALRATFGLDLTTPSPAYCSGGTALSGDDGLVSCSIVVPSTTKPGIYPMYAVVGGNTPLSFNLEVTAPAPAVPVATTATPVSGNNQSGAIGQALTPLVAVVKDQFGAIMADQTVQWSVVSGSATLTSPGTKTNASGQTSTGVTLGSTQGAVVIKVTAGTATASFNLTATVAIGNVAKVSGDGQSMVLGDQFQPVSVKVTDAQGNAVGGVTVQFAVTGGGATPASDSDVTDVSGVASATFAAPTSPSQVTITATAGGKTVTFTLSARRPGPVLTANSFLNGASMQPGVAFGSIVAIKGEGLTTGLSIPPGTCLSAVPDGNLERGLPTRLAGIEVRFEYVHLAPIFAVCKNLDGSEQVNVQAPFELAPAPINISVTTGIGTAMEMTVSVSGVQAINALPGIFEYNVTDTTRAAVALRPDGTVVSLTNRARLGEVIRVFTTGLGPVLPVGSVAVKTNQPGYPGQMPFFATSVQLANSGAPGVTAEYAQNLIGVFIVTFKVPDNAPVGDAIPLTVSVVTDNGQTVASRPSSIPIQ